MKKSTTIDAQVLLTKHGLKKTPLRMKLLEAIATTSSPLSVEELSRKLRGKGNVVTLYRALAAFLEAGIVDCVTIGGSARYQLAAHEHHLVCESCGVIESIDFCISGIEKKALLKSKRFKKLGRHSLEFFGICRKCT